MRTPILALLTLLAGCEWIPDVTEYEAKAAEDCPGQKACGWRCVDFDDPEAGCGREGCGACPAPDGANTVAVCGSHELCVTACAPGFADCDGAAGCERAVAADAANCGACGHACPAGDTCVDGQCQVMRTVSASGAQPRGLAITSRGLAWVNDPPVAGAQPPQGTLHLVNPETGEAIATVEGLGHPASVRSLGAARPELAIQGTDPEDDTQDIGWLVDTSQATPAAEWFESTGYGMVGIALTGRFYFAGYDPEWGQYGYTELANPDATGGGSDIGPLTGVGSGGTVDHVWLGQARYFLGEEVVAGRVQQWRDDPADDWGPEYVSGGALYFDALPPGVMPEAHRIGARATGTAGIYQVYFADLRDGSIWTGRTDLSEDPLSATPWRLVRGDGLPRTAMDVAADERGAVWSDLDAGEIWAVTPDGHKHRLAHGVRPWAIHLTATEVYFTDVAAQQVRAVPR